MSEDVEKNPNGAAEDEQFPGQIVGALVTPDKDETLEWILKGLGRSADTCVRRQAGEEAGEDAGQWFYELYFTECSIAVRADCLSAYMARVSKLASVPKLAELVDGCGFKDAEKLTSEQIRVSLMGDDPHWVLLVAGEEARSEGGVDYCYPGEDESPLQAAALLGWSKSLLDLIADEPSMEKLSTARAVVTLPGDQIGRVRGDGEGYDGRDIFGRPLPAKGLPGKPDLGDNVEQEGQNLKATEYGYILLERTKLCVVSPVCLYQNACVAYWFILDPRPHKVSVEMIDRWLDRLDVVEGANNDAIAHAVEQINAGNHTVDQQVIAEAVSADHGRDATLELLVDSHGRYGRLTPEGVIDLTKVSYGANVETGQEIARLLPPTDGADGRDLMGNRVPARDGLPLEVKAGANVRSEDGARGVVHYYAEADGAIKSIPGELAVVDTLIIDSDVGFDTGNLEFNGEIVIKGSVGQGFTVKATGNIFVFGSVDAGVTLMAGGDIVIGHGISGRRTRVVARGEIRVGWVEEARVRAGGDILIGSHAIQAILHADGVISVEEGTGPRGGAISGGEVWGLSGIQMQVAGSNAHNMTNLTAGMDPEGAKKLDLLNRKLEESNKLILRHLSRFQLQKLDVAAIQKRLAASTGPQKKVLARAAKQLGQLVQIHQGFLNDRKEIDSKVGSVLRTAYIEAADAMFPGVNIRIGDSQRLVKSPMKSARFEIRDESLVVK